MRLARRDERIVRAEVKGDARPDEPHPATTGQLARLRHLAEPEQVAVEPTRRVLAAGGDRQLDVVEAGEGHVGMAQTTRDIGPSRPPSETAAMA